MAHERQRHIHQLFQQLAKLSSIIGILGHRQVGKTTFLGQVANEYKTLDDEITLAQVTLSAKNFIIQLHPPLSAIDECQLAPNIFPALKEYVRTHKQPGQFILSGSVRFTSRKAIRESLTGRIATLELLPFSVAELEALPLPQQCVRLLDADSFSSLKHAPLQLSKLLYKKRTKVIAQYLEKGGLPGVCFIRDPKARENRIQEQLATLLDRDIRMVHSTTLSFRDILDFVRILTKMEGDPIHYEVIKRQTGISAVTQKKLLYALEGIFIIRHIPIEGGTHGFTILFEDQAEMLWLSEGKMSKEQQWEGLIYRNLRCQFQYQLGLSYSIFQYRSRAGAFVPIAIRTHQGILGVLPILTKMPTHSQIMAAHSFLRKYGDSKLLFISKDNPSATVFDERMAMVPAEWILFE